MTKSYYPLTSYLVALILAQGIKPFLMLRKNKKFDIKYAIASGGYPSSHSSSIVALCLSIGLQEGFDSPLFAVCFAITCIVLFDAINVRYYSGKNIQLTKQLISDLKDVIEKNDPIYYEKFKEVLGHTKLELITGVLLGIVVSVVLYFLWR